MVYFLIYSAPTVIAAGLAATGSTRGFRKPWGFILILPSLMLGALAVIVIIGVIVTEEQTPALMWIAYSFPIIVSALVIWRWGPKVK